MTAPLVWELPGGDLLVRDEETGLSIVGSWLEVRRVGRTSLEAMMRRHLHAAVSSYNDERTRLRDRDRAMRLADELTLDTQSAEDAVCDLIRQVREARADRDEVHARLGRIAALYNGFVNGEPRPQWAADQVLAAIGEALGPPWHDTGCRCSACAPSK